MSFVRVGTLADLPQGLPQSVLVGERHVALVRDGDTVHALADECTHARVLLSLGEFDAEAGTLECIGHGVRFDVRSGAPLEPPASQPVACYPTRIAGEDVLVDLANPTKEF